MKPYQKLESDFFIHNKGENPFKSMPVEDEFPLDREAPENIPRDFTQNKISLEFSWSLMNQIRYLARSEGCAIEALLVELIAESVTKRAFEAQNKPLPSHLMTRNGYVHNVSNGNSNYERNRNYRK